MCRSVPKYVDCDHSLRTLNFSPCLALFLIYIIDVELSKPKNLAAQKSTFHIILTQNCCGYQCSCSTFSASFRGNLDRNPQSIVQCLPDQVIFLPSSLKVFILSSLFFLSLFYTFTITSPHTRSVDREPFY